MNFEDQPELYDKLNGLCRIVKGFVNVSTTWNILKFYDRMQKSGSLEDFIRIFFDGNFYILSTSLYQFKQDNLIYTLTVPFHERRGAGVVPVFMTNTSNTDSWTRLGFFYMSRSQAVWRLLPLTIYGWYDKGEQGQHSLTVPWDFQLALDSVYTAMYRKLEDLGLSFPVIDASMFTMHDAVRSEVMHTVLIGVNNAPIVKTGVDNEDATSYTRNELTTDSAEIKREKRPNINDPRNLVSELVEWPVYGAVKRATIYSHDASLRYNFVLTAEGVFLGGVELVNARLSNYGIRGEYPGNFPSSLLVPLFEYPEELPVGAHPGEFRFDYVKVLSYHDQILSGLFANNRDYEFLVSKAPNSRNDARARMREVDQRLSRDRQGQRPRDRGRTHY